VRGVPAAPRSDIFNLGLILNELLSGRRAFQGETSVETTTAILKQEAPELPETVRCGCAKSLRAASRRTRPTAFNPPRTWLSRYPGTPARAVRPRHWPSGAPGAAGPPCSLPARCSVLWRDSSSGGQPNPRPGRRPG
jgi:serine/threonine-protein kinase